MSTSGLTPDNYGSILLTKLDRLTRDIIMAQIGTIEFDPTKIALLVVDMQNAFLNHRGSHGKLGLDTTLLEKTIGPVKALVDACHEAKIPVIFTRACGAPITKTEGVCSIYSPLYEKLAVW